jgi:hypothetical protein
MDEKKILEGLKRDAQSMIEAAARRDGYGDPYERDWRSAWTFVRKVANLEED